jgi:predicted DsbA family dithiol-disulfide isomerase
MPVVLYTDLNCPFCYATEERIAALGLEAAVEWKGVEHEPDLPIPMDVDDDVIHEELREEVGSVSGRAPEVPIALPGGKPNTRQALRVAAAAGRLTHDAGAAFRRDVYRAYWREGADLSDPEVIEAIARRHDADALNVTPDDDRQVTGWQLDWQRSPTRGVPLLVRHDGEVLYGLKDSDVLADFLRGV